MPLHRKRRDMLGRVGSLALVPGAAFAVHQLRYWLAFGGHAGAELREQGHSYLHSVVPWIVLLLALAAGLFLRSVGRAVGGGYSLPHRKRSFGALWLMCAAALVLIYVSQEFLEGLFATGHPGGLVGIFGDGGWWAVPAALAVGLALAAIFRGARWVLREVARRGAKQPARRSKPGRAPREPFVAPLAPLASGWSGRGPPFSLG